MNIIVKEDYNILKIFFSKLSIEEKNNNLELWFEYKSENTFFSYYD